MPGTPVEPAVGRIAPVTADSRGLVLVGMVTWKVMLGMEAHSEDAG
jgi:hypothetical protein